MPNPAIAKFAYLQLVKAAAKKVDKMKKRKAKKKALKRGKNKANAYKRVVRNQAGVVPNPKG